MNSSFFQSAVIAAVLAASAHGNADASDQGAATIVAPVSPVDVNARADTGVDKDNDSDAEAEAGETKPRPNIVFILADDLGFTDIAPYGSEVNTPNLTALAERGLSFNNYHTAPICAPSRAMLLTGVSNHLAGVPQIPEMLPPEQRSYSHYQGVLGSNVVTLATLLEDAGYNTYMAGKWHLGKTPEKLPSSRGFKRTVAMLDSGADNWDDRSYLPFEEKANWYADGERFELPEDFYSSRFLVDKMIEFIDSGQGGEGQDGQEKKPFFAYLPFQAVHIPVQAPQEYIDRYMGVYDGGWDELRQQRFERAVELGIVPEGIAMRRMDSTGDWQALSPERKRYEAKRMAVYAAMIEAMDFHIGRLIAYLEARGELDNTVFVFTSDNGSEGSGEDNPQNFISTRSLASIGYNTDYETLGLERSYNTIGASFASASASPLAYFKFYTGEGGMRVPLIVAGAGIQQRGLSNAFAWATDITPTLLSIAGVAQPGERYAGRKVLPITGKDLSPVLSGEQQAVYGEDDAVGFELAGQGALFQGDYKLLRTQAPLGDGEWRLFNIAKDPGETKDLAAVEPTRFRAMMEAYKQFEQDNQVLPMPLGFSPMKQLAANIIRHRLGEGFIVLLLSILVLMPFYVAYRMKRSA